MKETNNSECNNLHIFGIKPLIEAIDAGKDVDRIFIQKGLKSPHFSPLWDRIKDLKIPFRYVPADRLRKITSKNHQGVVAFLSPISLTTIDQVLPGVYERGEDPFFLVLDRITDVGNFGAIVRTAEVAGVHAIVLPEKNSAPLSGDAVKTSAGALMRVPICRERKLPSKLQELKDSGLKVVAVTEKASQNIYETTIEGPVVFVMGSEEDGISPEILSMADVRVQIPMFGHVGSLNVSVATGIALFEYVRQTKIIVKI